MSENIPKYPHHPESALSSGFAVDFRLPLAIDFIKSHAMVAAIEDGEDSTGRQRLRLQTPEEAVTRGLQMADLLVAEAEKRGWITRPSLQQTVSHMVTQSDVTSLIEMRRWDRSSTKQVAKQLGLQLPDYQQAQDAE